VEAITGKYYSIVGNLKPLEPFNRQQLYDVLIDAGNTLSYNSLSSVVAELMETGKIARVGRNRYVTIRGKQAVYCPPVSECLALVIAAVSDEFPLVEFLAWDTLALNEFINHQIANGTILVEVEGMLEHAVFEHLRQKPEGTVLYKPSPQTLATYWEPDAVIIQKLTTQAPGDKTSSHLAGLEKLIVDLFANKLLGTLFSQGDLPSMLEQMFARYVIDESKLFRYAKRRNCYEKIMAFVNDKTNIVLRTRQ
jgi:hypothetical protein